MKIAVLFKKLPAFIEAKLHVFVCVILPVDYMQHQSDINMVGIKMEFT